MMHRNRSHRPAAPVGASSTAGLLLSLASSLPAPDGALGRSACHLAHRLAQGTSNRADLDAASDMLARLLDETDVGLAYDEDGLLDEGFDL